MIVFFFEVIIWCYGITIVLGLSRLFKRQFCFAFFIFFSFYLNIWHLVISSHGEFCAILAIQWPIKFVNLYNISSLHAIRYVNLKLYEVKVYINFILIINWLLKWILHCIYAYKLFYMHYIYVYTLFYMQICKVPVPSCQESRRFLCHILVFTWTFEAVSCHQVTVHLEIHSLGEISVIIKFSLKFIMHSWISFQMFNLWKLSSPYFYLVCLFLFILKQNWGTV